MIEAFVEGVVGRDPEQKAIASGKMIASFSVASNRTKDETDWVSIACFSNSMQDYALASVKKGDRVRVFGKFTYNVGTDGRVFLNIAADSIRVTYRKKAIDEPAYEPTPMPELNDIPF